MLGMAVSMASFCRLFAQGPSFFHIDKSGGLSDNTVTSVVTDNNGLLWIGTLNGLNSYDGYSVRNFYTRDYPGLQTDIITRLVCDSKNRIWIQAADGRLSMMDDQRQFHSIPIPANRNDTTVDYLLPVVGKPMFLNNGCLYILDERTGNFIRTGEDEPLFSNRFERINIWDEDHLVFSGSDMSFLFDIRTFKVSPPIQVPGIIAAARISADTAIVTTTGDCKIYKVSFSSGRVGKCYENVKDQYGDPLHPVVGSIRLLKGQQFLITSPRGLYVFDVGLQKLVRYQHNVFDDQTIADNHTTYLFAGNEFHFIATAGAGLNYFKYNMHIARTKSVFYDARSGLVYNGYITAIAEDASGNYWIGASNALIRWSNGNDGTTFFLPGKRGEHVDYGAIRTMHIDKRNNRIWLGTATGIVIIDPKFKTTSYLKRGGPIPDHSINKITAAPDGELWICTSKGIYFIDANSFEIRLPDKRSPLALVSKAYCNLVWFQNETNVWIGTRSGAHHINLLTNDSKTYTTADGLAFDEVTGLEGTDNEVYIGTRFGFHILNSGTIQSYKQLNDVWPVDCHSMVKDRRGTIWIANSDYLASYSPETKHFTTFDDRAGINQSGFHFYSAVVAESGELVFGSNRGVTYFKPDDIQVPEPPITVMVYEVQSMNHIYRPTPGAILELPYAANSVSFSFSAINLLSSRNLFYQYRLEDGNASDWTKISADRQQVAYHNLKPGRYGFNVRSSADGVRWVEASNPLSFVILTPWWKEEWFIQTCLLGGICLLGFVVWRRDKKVRHQREQLEIEQTINYLATSLHGQQTVDAMLWDVAKNCFGRLKFEDCVIYLVDEKRKLLIQKAAWGPKTTNKSKIINPIEIPVGNGIVGYVAFSAIAEIVPDTAKDRRYIVDDAVRRSEITVPIIYNNCVLGIIDSEHPKKGFFTQKHLSVLTSIAALCANKIIRLKAEEERQRVQMELLVHERKTVEAQLKSLRLQMNPHFLFNSLNSIQQMILARDENAATRYLSKFSRLLRLVLAHADRETLKLNEELETLNLYIELESLRFKDKFHFTITCDDEIDPDEIRIPAMLIQPFVENAIWHGLLHKHGDRNLSLHFIEDIVENLVCIIEDNGVGREVAGKVSADEHTGKGIATASERLDTYNEYRSLKTGILIEDLRDENGKGIGTRIILTIPSL